MARIPTRIPRCYQGNDVPMAAIRRFARQVGKRFQPERIILFGSHAYGKPHADSDVDLNRGGAGRELSSAGS